MNTAARIDITAASPSPLFLPGRRNNLAMPEADKNSEEGAAAAILLVVSVSSSLSSPLAALEVAITQVAVARSIFSAGTACSFHQQVFLL